MTWNVNAPLGTEDVEIVRTGLISKIEKYDPDILCLQELSKKQFKKIHVPLDSIFCYSDEMSINKEAYRFWIYSKRNIRNFKRYKCVIDIDNLGFDRLQLDEIEKIKKAMPVFSADIEVNPDRWITVFACHLRSSAYSTARRSMEKGSSWFDGLSLYINNYKMGKKIRDYEAENIRIILDSLEKM